MSQENVEIVRRMWDAFLGSDPASGLSFVDPDIEWDGTNLPDGKMARGHEAIVEHAARWAEMWNDWRVEPEQFIDGGGDQVILVFRETGRSEGGLQMDERHAELYTLREGKIVYRKGFTWREGLVMREQAWFRWEEGLRAAGLDPDAIALPKRGRAGQ